MHLSLFFSRDPASRQLAGSSVHRRLSQFLHQIAAFVNVPFTSTAASQKNATLCIVPNGGWAVAGILF